jgi:hypothetical protein
MPIVIYSIAIQWYGMIRCGIDVNMMMWNKQYMQPVHFRNETANSNSVLQCEVTAQDSAHILLRTVSKIATLHKQQLFKLQLQAVQRRTCSVSASAASGSSCALLCCIVTSGLKLVPCCTRLAIGESTSLKTITSLNLHFSTCALNKLPLLKGSTTTTAAVGSGCGHMISKSNSPRLRLLCVHC